MDDNTEDIQAIFPPAISQQIRTAIHQHPDLRPLFHTIATYVRDPASLKVPIPSHPALDTSVKKRKLDELDSGVNGHSIANATRCLLWGRRRNSIAAAAFQERGGRRLPRLPLKGY